MLAALQAGKNPATAPATTRMITVDSATLKLMEGLLMYWVSMSGPTNSSRARLDTSPMGPQWR